eukprot:COSAG02_NODE_47872_length_338_cov_0.631799_1_plen_25_part_01
MLGENFRFQAEKLVHQGNRGRWLTS